jgi:DNA-binding response OmpR family regulator
MAATQRRLLIVEDDPTLRSIYAEALTMDGFEVVAAADGIEAFGLFLEKGPFDALIVDQDMPGLTGRQLLERLRKQGEGAPALLMSGRLELSKAEQQALRVGPVLGKPFTFDQLFRAVTALLPAKA